MTNSQAGVTTGASVEFLGDFEPPAAAQQPSQLVEVHVALQSKDKTETSTHKTSLEKGGAWAGHGWAKVLGFYSLTWTYRISINI